MKDFVGKLCKTCDGRGSVGGAMEIRCTDCNGKGYIKVLKHHDNTDNNEENPDICGGCSQQCACGDANPE